LYLYELSNVQNTKSTLAPEVFIFIKYTIGWNKKNRDMQPWIIHFLHQVRSKEYNIYQKIVSIYYSLPAANHFMHNKQVTRSMHK